MDDDPAHPRVLIADEDQHRITEIADIISGSGHTVVARLFDVSEVVEATQRDHPDVAIVALDGHESHALDLLGDRRAGPVPGDRPSYALFKSRIEPD